MIHLVRNMLNVSLEDYLNNGGLFFSENLSEIQKRGVVRGEVSDQGLHHDH